MRDDIDRGQPECVDEADRVAGHGLDGVGDGPAGGGYTGVVEQNDLTVAGEGVAQSGVVIVQGAHEMLEEQQWSASGEPETTVGEACPASLGVLGRGCVVRELSHDVSVPAPPGVTVSES